MMGNTNQQIRVLHVDDDAFTRGVTQTALASFGYQTRAAANAEEFIAGLETFDPHVVLVDLDLGAGPSGVQLLRIVQRDAPWVGRVIISSHRSLEFVEADTSDITGMPYIVKSDLASSDQIRQAIDASLTGETFIINDAANAVHLTRAQADILRMIAAGMSNEAIAAERGTSLRGVERIISRTFAVLGVSSDAAQNPRVAASTMLTTAQVIVD